MVNMASGRVREWNRSTLSLLGHYLHVRMYSTHTPPSTSTHMHTVWGLNNFRITHIHTKTHRHINWSVICYLWEQMWRFSWWQFKGWSDLTTFYCHRCVCVCVCVCLRVNHGSSKHGECLARWLQHLWLTSILQALCECVLGDEADSHLPSLHLGAASRWGVTAVSHSGL